MSTSSPVSSLPDVGAVVVAAGSGRRAGGEVAKQFREIAGIPMLLRALRPFLAHPAVGLVVAVIPAHAVTDPPRWLVPSARLRLVAGGAERIDSVELGLAALDDRCQVVVVHDGARPFVGRSVIDAVIEAARQGDGAVAGVPVADTIKRANGAAGARTVAATVPREGLWRAQTPQAFPIELIRRGLAHARATQTVSTDDAAMVEAVGARIVLVPDHPANIKITATEDFELAEAIARVVR